MLIIIFTHERRNTINRRCLTLQTSGKSYAIILRDSSECKCSHLLSLRPQTKIYDIRETYEVLRKESSLYRGRRERRRDDTMLPRRNRNHRERGNVGRFSKWFLHWWVQKLEDTFPVARQKFFQTSLRTHLIYYT